MKKDSGFVIVALLDLVVMSFLFEKYPSATSGQLTLARSRAVCAPTLATIGVKRLSLHQHILANNVALGKAMAKAVPVHLKMSYEEIVLEGWKYDPPKAMSDLVESIFGAILVDSGYDYERTQGVIERVMEPILNLLRPNLPRDPTSELMLSLARKGCRRAKFEKYASEPEKNSQSDSIRFKVHDLIVGSPLRSPMGLSRAKPLLAQIVHKQLEDPISEFYLEHLCDCKATKGESKAPPTLIPEDIDREKLDDEREEEFAVLGILELREAAGVLEVMSSDEDEEVEDEEVEEEEVEEEEVDRMVTE